MAIVLLVTKTSAWDWHGTWYQSQFQKGLLPEWDYNQIRLAHAEHHESVAKTCSILEQFGIEFREVNVDRNLFGAIHEAEVHANQEGEWEITKITQGDPIDELLVSRNYDMTEITDAYSNQLNDAVAAGNMTEQSRNEIYDKLVQYTKGYPYLVEG